MCSRSATCDSPSICPTGKAAAERSSTRRGRSRASRLKCIHSRCGGFCSTACCPRGGPPGGGRGGGFAERGGGGGRGKPAGGGGGGGPPPGGPRRLFRCTPA